jgi:hypothetical protein
MLTFTQITGTFNDGSQQPLSNIGISFAPSETVYAAGIPVVTPDTPITAAVVGGVLKSASGATLQLLDTNNAGLTIEGRTGFWFWTVTITGQLTDSFSFFLPHSATPVDLYSLANTSASGGGGFTNPMTTLGDLISGVSGGSAVRLPGNTASVREFLTSQGSGGVATAPAYSALQAGDISAAFPWQFYVDNPAYGAKGDGKVIGDVATTSGSAVITSATANFTSADVGKFIMIHGANGTTSGPLISTILSRQSATQVTLGTSAGATVSNCPAVYGTDDTAAINAAVTAAGNYATANSYFAEVVFGARIYILGTGPTQTGNGSTTPTFNAQIPLPFPAAANTTQKLVIALTGAGDNGYLQYWNSLIPNVAGTALVSMVTAPKPYSATFGMQSVVGGPTGAAGFGGSPAYANTKVVVKGIGIWCPLYTNLCAWDFGYVSDMRPEASAAHIFAPTGVNGSAVQPYLNNISAAGLTNSVSVGWRFPVTSNNADISASDVAVEGYELGYLIFDHFDGHKLNAIYCDVIMKFDGTQGASGVSHGIFISSITAEAYNGGFLASGGNVQVDINWDSECNAAPAYDFSDGGNVHGVFRFRDPANARFPVVSGGGKVKIICDELGPGPWSGAPAAPTQNVAQQNTAWRDATVWVTSTAAITAVAIDGTPVFSGSVAAGVPFLVRVPGGHTYTVTSAGGTLTTHWVLE